MLNFLLILLTSVMPACADEAADNCYWDASSQGNRVGSSFLVINNNVFYL